MHLNQGYQSHLNNYLSLRLVYVTAQRAEKYSLPSINVNPWEWIKVNIYRGVNS